MEEFRELPEPENFGRYSDEQLYALALYVYSLQPPPNPNRFDRLAARGQNIFKQESCGTCHTPPLYTNNKLTPVKGFDIPPAHKNMFDILRISVGTDPGLALLTRRGTGYYKVPSLKGPGIATCSRTTAPAPPWRTGSIAPPARRLRPTGFKGYQVERRAVPGHEFGLSYRQTISSP
jgi:hypothetical protein